MITFSPFVQKRFFHTVWIEAFMTKPCDSSTVMNSKLTAEPVNGNNISFWSAEIRAHLEQAKLCDYLSSQAQLLLEDPEFKLTRLERYKFKQDEVTAREVIKLRIHLSHRILIQVKTTSKLMWGHIHRLSRDGQLGPNRVNPNCYKEDPLRR